MDRYEGYIGKVLDGRYKILELVGVGGMAFVLKAEDLVMNRIVAIKILNDQYNGDEQAEKRFINESKAVAMLSNKNIVCIYDVAIFPDIKYIVMEYLDGITLKEYIDNKQNLNWKEACLYITQILKAIEHAHSKDVIHRDLKPQNIILLKNGEIKVTDFGIAKTPNMAPITVTDKAIGTVYYISPEQAGGKETTVASDIYSIGVMLYECVTGKLPFIADSPVAIAMMQINDTAVPPHEVNPEIPIGLSQIIMKAMEKDPAQRFKDVHSMLNAITYVVKNQDVIFNNTLSAEGEESPEYIDINMVDTGEIGEYSIPEPDLKAKEPENNLEETKEEKKLKRKKKREERQSHSLFPVISGVFFAFMIVAVIVGGYVLIKWVPTLFAAEPTEEFVVVDLKGRIYNDALKVELEKEKYIITIKEAEFPMYEYMEIVEQDPVPGPKIIASGICRITLTVNTYNGELKVPNIKYMTETEAIRLLRQYGIEKYNVKRISDPYANEGQVIRTDPQIGDPINSSQEILIYVCEGSGVTTAQSTPNVVGDSVENAIKKLEDAYYTYEISWVKSNEPQGKVLTQSVSPYTTNLPAWTVVKLEVSQQSTDVKVPVLNNLTLEQAKSALETIGLVLGEISYNPNSPMEIGRVCGQSVAENTYVEIGTVVDIVISGTLNTDADPVPSVVGLNKDMAQIMLINSGYAVTIEFRDVISGNADIVLEQSIPANTTGLAKDTPITIIVSRLATTVTVPDLFGLTLNEVIVKLTETGLQLGNYEYDPLSIFTPGTVVEQSILHGEVVDINTVIDIVISGPES
ncbi:Stk1 family PASTA domain-containing Ser/Thr kinase [Eubacteriales bacterium OttesenSCG-928-G02]|nr:Stk1 family PASTA domain-containing Ser/Thr kinase [Eubacteriales bacterium OttesenSCG-928-G02]